MSVTLSNDLAAFAVDSRWEDLPVEVRHAAERSLLNGFATAFAGCRDTALAAMHATLLPFAGAPTASLIGRTAMTDPLTAAFINAAAMNVHDFDDTHLRTVIHPTAPVAPALMALAQDRRVAGKEFLHALALGIETACRVGNAVSPGHYARGWHITATCGVFGAAVAAGKVLGLDRAQMLHALGAASAQASGLVETLGFMAKSVGVGSACRGGLTAALLAANGLDGPSQPLEGPRGFLRVTGDDPSWDEISGELGSRWETLKNIHKPYPGGVVLFPVIDACLALHAEGLRPQHIAKVTLYGNPLLGQRTDRPNVETGREAQVSAQHAVAVCFVQGAAGLDQFSDAAVQDQGVRALRALVSVEDDENCAVEGVRVAIECRDGTTTERVVRHARGTDERPLSDVEIEDKLKALIGGAEAPGVKPEPLIEAVWTLAQRQDASMLMKLVRPA